MKTRKFFARFRPYEWETPTEQIAASTGIPPDRVFRLDTNTSPFIPLASLKGVARRLSRLGVNGYPDTSYAAIRRLLSSYCGVGADRFVVTNGADEGLDIIAKTFLDPGDEAVVASPSYSMFRITAEIMGGRVRQVPRRSDFSVDVPAMLRGAGERTRVFFLCSPNNPTGNATPVEDILSLAESTDAVVAVDEAYFEFAGGSAVELTAGHENVVVIRTFSKAFSMAGVRVGYLVASERTVGELNKVRPPNSLSVVSLALAEDALRRVGTMRRNVRLIVSERERCIREMSRLAGLEVYPSDANFILFRVRGADANKVHAALMRKGFVLRNLADVPMMENCLRVGVSTPEVNDAFLDALPEALEEP